MAEAKSEPYSIGDLILYWKNLSSLLQKRGIAYVREYNLLPPIPYTSTDQECLEQLNIFVEQLLENQKPSPESVELVDTLNAVKVGIEKALQGKAPSSSPESLIYPAYQKLLALKVAKLPEPLLVNVGKELLKEESKAIASAEVPLDAKTERGVNIVDLPLRIKQLHEIKTAIQSEKFLFKKNTTTIQKTPWLSEDLIQQQLKMVGTTLKRFNSYLEVTQLESQIIQSMQEDPPSKDQQDIQKIFQEILTNASKVKHDIMLHKTWMLAQQAAKTFNVAIESMKSLTPKISAIKKLSPSGPKIPTDDIVKALKDHDVTIQSLNSLIELFEEVYENAHGNREQEDMLYTIFEALGNNFNALCEVQCTLANACEKNPLIKKMPGIQRALANSAQAQDQGKKAFQVPSPSAASSPGKYEDKSRFFSQQPAAAKNKGKKESTDSKPVSSVPEKSPQILAMQ